MEKGDLYIRSLAPKDLNEMYFAFLDSFSDYPITFRLNKEEFVRKFVEKLKIDFSLSLGAFDYDALAGFIFTSVNYYNNVLTAYNGGTGVRPNFRGRKVTYQMYDHLIPKIKDKGVKQCVLEVLIQNAQALNVYRSIGFREKRTLLSFMLIDDLVIQKETEKLNLEILKVYQPDWAIYEPFQDFNPSFLDSKEMIIENLANEEIIEARYEGDTVGYAIFQPALGRLSQMAVRKDMRHKSIGSSLMKQVYAKSYTKQLTVINVNEEDKGTVRFLERIGFENRLNQFEMFLTV
ncbi:MAG: GNAT family N-acetyltransferase [Candidatus Cyclobacteriaceae bacterium M2_1C_046]